MIARTITAEAPSQSPGVWHTLLLYMLEKRYNEWEKAIDGGYPPQESGGQGKVIDQMGASFTNDYSMNLGLVRTDETPHLNLVIVGPEGTEKTTFSPPINSLEKTPSLVIDGEAYQVGVVPKKVVKQRQEN